MNKILLIICALAGMFCVLMAVWYMTFPVEQYEQRVQQAQAQLEQAEADLAQREQTAKMKLEEARAAHETAFAQLTQLQAEQETKTAEHAALREQLTQLQNMPQEIEALRQTYGEKVRQLEDMILAGETEIKICYLTFDDGPNNLTAAILERLEEMDVYATFFTIGTNDAKKQEQNLRAEMMAGHTVANHTYSHAIEWGLYSNMEEFTKQVLLQDEKVYNATGFHMDLFRFPSGSVMCPFLEEAEAWLEENGYKWIDWNSSAWDSGFSSFTASPDRISTNVYYNSKDLPIAVVLCHDFNYSTYDALKLFIPRLRNEGFIFLPLFPQSHMLDAPLPVV